MDRVEVIMRVERRRKWADAEKAAVLAETDVPGTDLAAVARKHAWSAVYNWRSARRAQAIAAIPGARPVEFIPIGVIGEDQVVASPEPPSMAAAGSEPTPSDQSVVRRAYGEKDGTARLSRPPCVWGCTRYPLCRGTRN